jgi:hypothetical protein
VPVVYETDLPPDVVTETPLERRNGLPWWRVTVPANGRASVTYRPR